MLVSGRVLLRLEERVKVPERAFYEVVGRHLGEAAETQRVTFVRLKCVFFSRSQLLTPSPGRSA